MRRWRDQRGHGPLRITHDRSAARRAHPIERALTAQRWAMLRRRWPDLVKPAVALLVICACLALPSPGHVQLRGFTVGVCAGSLLTLVAGVLMVLDGSLLRRIGRGVERDVGDDLRRVRGVHGVVSSLMFAGCDVDHVVLTPTGIWVVEVKWSLSPAADLDHVLGLQRHLDQARAGTRKVAGLLRAAAPGVPVHTVLVLAGPGAPHLEAPVYRDGVTVVNNLGRRAWATLLATGDHVLTLNAARPAARALTDLRDARIAYELTHH